ncbi:ABC transporter permease subunit [Reyranella aquatilis]|uniref:ABC transporter permease subunit n=1 Tax=Reyranella aquatilis TaxID=2035356 RepID=A0ABS8KSI8_9HYPH|nr:ABC transporter permease subunit [Reyranella aquatilis]MCC8429032.1 ABC transporter permease subunit [Reyranella aquatilis]
MRTSRNHAARPAAPPLGLGGGRFAPNLFDAAIFLLIVGVFVLLGHGVREMTAPVAQLGTPVTLDPANLPEYALRTTLRMFAAIVASLVFTLVVATLAARSRKAELVIVPALDILQSVPVLGFLTFTVAFFLQLFPGSVLGAECAAIFAIFTSQAWNMAFSFYQSLRTVPRDLDEVARHFRFSPWLRFWRLDVPFAAPGLIWNTMMSMSGGWFFVVASEAITVGDTTVTLPGIGSWLALAIQERDIHAVLLAVATMAAVILAYDQLIFRPIVAWADKFRFEQTAADSRPRSWLYDFWRRARMLPRITRGVGWLVNQIARLPTPITRPPGPPRATPASRRGEMVFAAILAGLVGYAAWHIVTFTRATLSLDDLRAALGDGLLTLVRVLVLIALASFVWVPVGVWIGLRPRLATALQPVAQFLAAFPANVVFPVAVVAIVSLRLDPNVWLSPLMILGTQWYILFNVIAGASAIQTDLRDVAALYRLGAWQKWRQLIVPAILPYYVTGALTAAGGSWNASIVAEVASWGDTHLRAEGLGAYIADATAAGDFPRVVLGIVVMSGMVIACNRLLWRPLYRLAENRFRVE